MREWLQTSLQLCYGFLSLRNIDKTVMIRDGQYIDIIAYRDIESLQ